jgi:2,4-dienoyl-CoA reductase-like NADH-dependent reductase (Old Yellow Enzyme family)
MLLHRIERHLQQRRMSETRFGREAVGDPNLISQLRDGRELRERTAQRVSAYLERNEHSA